MSVAITITATLPAWLPTYSSPLRMLDQVGAGKYQEAVGAMHFTDSDMGRGSDPWTRVGAAEITVTLVSKDEIVSARLAALQSELDAERAKWLTRQQEILAQINTLRALPMAEEVPT